MEQRVLPCSPCSPAPRLHVLVEDPAAATAAAVNPAGVDIRVCSGPEDGDTCPLVYDDRCPLGPVDVVVTRLRGEWTEPVRRAWSHRGIPVVSIDDAPLDAAVVAGVQAMWLRALRAGSADTAT